MTRFDWFSAVLIFLIIGMCCFWGYGLYKSHQAYSRVCLETGVQQKCAATGNPNSDEVICNQVTVCTRWATEAGGK